MSFPAYDNYKDSGIEWLGKVPSDWMVTSLKRVSLICYGIGEPPKYQEDGTRLVRATNVSRGSISDEGMVYVDPTHIPEKRIVWLVEGDIIVVRSGAYTGDSAIIPDGYGKAIAGFDMVVRVHGVFPKFAQYALLSNYIKDFQLELKRMRAAQPHLNAEELGECVFVAPDLDEQKAISSFLDVETAKIDALVSEQRRLIELLKEKRQAVISHTVTKGLNPDAPMKPSGIQWLGDVPQHWEIMKLGRVTLDRCDGPFGSGLKSSHYTDVGIRVIRLNNIRHDYFDDSDAAFIDPNHYHGQLGGGHDVVAGDLLIAGLGDSNNAVGRACVAPDGIEPAMVKADCFRYRIDTERTLTAFLSAQLTIGAPTDAGLMSTGTTRSRMPLSVTSSRMIAFPPIEEQQEIIDHVGERAETFSQLQAEAERAIELLQERRTALISAAVTGKIDLREFGCQEAK